MEFSEVWGRIVGFIGLLLLVSVLTTIYLYQTGFCFAEGQYMDERDLIMRFRSGSQWSELSSEDREKKWNEIDGCCDISKEGRFSILFGVEYDAAYLVTTNSSGDLPYSDVVGTMNTCGQFGEIGREPISEEKYQRLKEHRKNNYWKR